MTARRSITWILGPADDPLPATIARAAVSVIRLATGPAPSRRPRRRLRIVSAWDDARAGRLAGGNAVEQHVARAEDLAEALQPDVIVACSGNFGFCSWLAHTLGRPVQWVTIGPLGASAPDAAVGDWLSGGTVSAAVTRLAPDGALGEPRHVELRPVATSPAITRDALLRAALGALDPPGMTDPHHPSSATVGSVQPADAPKPHAVSTPAPDPAPKPKATTELAIVWRTLRGRLQEPRPRRDQWTIGIAAALDAPSLATTAGIAAAARAVRWIDPGPDRFIADPFLAEVQGRRMLFFEELCFREPKGRLKAVVLTDDGDPAGPEALVLETSHHLSFPGVFTDPQDPTHLFLLPEQAGSGKTVLYRSAAATEPARLRFQPMAELLHGFSGIDPVLDFHDGHWYLFVSDGRYGNHDNNLYLFHSERLAGPYRPHPHNPIHLGLRGSRMAGHLARLEGGLFRPGQDCAGRYGAAVILHRIEALTPSAYREAEVAALTPAHTSPYPLGLHTLSMDAGLLAIDGLRRIPEGP